MDAHNTLHRSAVSLQKENMSAVQKLSIIIFCRKMFMAKITYPYNVQTLWKYNAVLMKECKERIKDDVLFFLYKNNLPTFLYFILQVFDNDIVYFIVFIYFWFSPCLFKKYTLCWSKNKRYISIVWFRATQQWHIIDNFY